jgi:hypothetical protein
LHAVQGASKKGEKEEIAFSDYTPGNGFSFLIFLARLFRRSRLVLCCLCVSLVCTASGKQ